MAIVIEGPTPSVRQVFQISQVLMPPRRFLVPLQIIEVDKAYFNAVDFYFQARWITLAEFHAIDSCNYIDSVRGMAKLNDVILLHEIILGQSQRCKAEVCQRLHARCVVCRYLNPYIEVLGISWVPMKRDGVSSNNQVFDTVIVQRSYKLFEILAQHRTSTDDTRDESLPARLNEPRRTGFASTPNQTVLA